MTKYVRKHFVMDDLDRAILKELPVEGTKIGKYINDGRSVAQLTKAVDPSVKSTVFSGRVKALEYHGFVLMTKGASGSETVYQATQAGKKALNGKVETPQPVQVPQQ